MSGVTGREGSLIPILLLDEGLKSALNPDHIREDPYIDYSRVRVNTACSSPIGRQSRAA
jgi:hypothetical protein